MRGSRLAAQRRYLKRLTRQVRKAVLQERRRQERLRARPCSAAWPRSGRPGRLAAAPGRGFGGAGAPRARPAGRSPSPGGSSASRVSGASGPSSYDCSGLMVAACRSAGVWLPWVSRAQFSAGPRVGLGSLAPGDLVFFAYNTGNPGSIHHVGVYIGGGAMIEAPIPGPGARLLHRPPERHRRRPADRLTVSERSERILLVRLRGRDPRGPTPRTSFMSMSQVGPVCPDCSPSGTSSASRSHRAA